MNVVCTGSCFIPQEHVAKPEHKVKCYTLRVRWTTLESLLPKEMALTLSLAKSAHNQCELSFELCIVVSPNSTSLPVIAHQEGETDDSGIILHQYLKGGFLTSTIIHSQYMTETK